LVEITRFLLGQSSTTIAVATLVRLPTWRFCFGSC
jgi:hypothetical protein